MYILVLPVAFWLIIAFSEAYTCVENIYTFKEAFEDCSRQREVYDIFWENTLYWHTYIVMKGLMCPCFKMFPRPIWCNFAFQADHVDMMCLVIFLHLTHYPSDTRIGLNAEVTLSAILHSLCQHRQFDIK